MTKSSFVRWVYSLRILPRWVIIIIDLVTITFSFALGYLLRFNFSLADILHNNFGSGVLLAVACSIASIFITSSYKGIVRYTGIQDAIRIFQMLLFTSFLATAVNVAYYFNGQGNIIPYSVLLISFLASFLFLFNYRLLIKYIFSFYNRGILKNSNVLIFGAGQTGITTKQVIDSSPSSRVIGFLEDDVYKIGKVLNGSKIYSARQEVFESLIKGLDIDELIITLKNLSPDRKNEIADICLRNNVKMRVVPPVDQWVKGELSLSQIKEVKIEDLLGRDAIKLDSENISAQLGNKRICITGAAGSIGSELVRQVIRYNPEVLILIDQAESPLYEVEREIRAMGLSVRVFPYLANITNKDRISFILSEHKPEIIFHAAAYKHVPLMESNPSEAILCNIMGTKMLADLAVEKGVDKFVMISTDKAVNPTNVMGCSKRIAEIYVQSLNYHLGKTGKRHTHFVTTRFGNVLGSNGSVIPIFKKQIDQGGPITVTHPEVTRFFMTIPEACQLVLEAGVMGKGGEIFIFDMGSSVKIYDLAKKMIWLSGLELDKDISIVFTGLREGEKLYEELLNQKENTIPTYHDKIMIAKIDAHDYHETNKYIELFNDLIPDRNELKMVTLMKELVPEFKSNYSRYEVLDRIS